MAETNGLWQFIIFLYKGFLLRKRHYMVTFFEIVIPILIATLPCMIISERYTKSEAEDFKNRGDKFWVKSSTPLPFDPFYSKPSVRSLELVYTPKNTITEQFMNDSSKMFHRNTQYNGSISVRGMKTEKEMESYSVYKLQKEHRNHLIIGTVFYGFGDKLPASLNYKIRYGSGIYGISFATSVKYQDYRPRRKNKYSSSTFLAWQASVEQTFIQKKAVEQGKNINYKVWMQQFPFPEHRDTDNSFPYVYIIYWVLGYGYLFFIINIVYRVVEEKSNGSKELLKMMGMTDFTYWASTFMNFFIIGFVTMFIITIIYKVPLKHSIVFLRSIDFMILLIILSLYMASLVLFCMLFSIFFNRTLFAIIALLLVYILSFSLLLGKLFLWNSEINYFPLSVLSKLGICLLPPGALLTCFYFISFYEFNGKGVQWYNMTEFSLVPDMNMLMILGVMLFSCGLYAILIWYFDAVWPWQPGVPKPFYFFLTRCYWRGSKHSKGEETNLMNNENSSEFFEEEPSGVSPGVVIGNLFKEFRTGLRTKLAVNDLSLNFYQGQITALLGHNGAGKTTTVNILAGLYTPSSGTASINGFDLLTETTKARRGLGVCPQQNVFYNTLTVEEHLRMYAAMKGVPWNRLDSETTDILNMLKLADQRTKFVKYLSGGMKRKLSLGIAIIGGSKVLFLDEPTSGMDVEARRNVWDALLEIRHNRTIVLTTHYMEEADVLGDRIAIMAEGEIQCCGSPMFLKQKFGTGYRLHVMKDVRFDLDALTSLINKYIPEVTLENDLENEISFNLSSNFIGGFGDMFEELENCKAKLGIVSFGVTITTLEDVFLNVSNNSDQKYKLYPKTEKENGIDIGDEDVYGDSPGLKPHPNPVNQFIALLLKRFHYSKRHLSILVAQVAIPFFIMCLCLYIIKLKLQNKFEFDSLKLDIYSVYGPTDGFYYEINPQLLRLAETLKNVYESNRINVEKVPNPTHYVLDYGKKDIFKYSKSFLVGGTVDQYPNGTMNLTAWFNGVPFHSLPMSLLLMHTALLRNITNTGSISLINSPFPDIISDISEEDYFTVRDLALIFVPLAFGVLSASFTLVPIHERATKAKLLQIMSGIPAALYWIAMFIWDFMVHCIVSILLIIPYAIFAHYAFFGIHSEAMCTSLLLMLLYGWSSIPFSYLISFMFKKESVGFFTVVGFCTIIGVGCARILNLYRAVMPSSESIDLAIWGFRFFPIFSLASGMSSLYGVAFRNAYCENVPRYDLELHCNLPTVDGANYLGPLYKCCKDICSKGDCRQIIYPIQWNMNSSGQDILFLFIDGIIYFGLVLFMETKTIATILQFAKHHAQKIRTSVLGQGMHENIVEDSNVLEEDQRIRNLLATHGFQEGCGEHQTRSDPFKCHSPAGEMIALCPYGTPSSGGEALLVSDLTKLFKNLYAVNHLTFGIHQKECFGFLGVNGAGKTTTFRMLTGDFYPTEGNAFLQNCSLNKDLKKFQSYIGYCPQFDALIDRLTGRETLMLFGQLRGLTGADLQKKVEKLIKMFDLTKHADKQTQFYSGGNKRKLSVAIALIGSPPFLLLDEPTAGVDPVSRRKIWNILSQARNNTGAAVLLSTHNMEESEALCNRLAIMVNGRFRCLGSIQQLKKKYGRGYTLIIKLKREDQNDYKITNAIKAHVQGKLSGANLKDDHQGTLQYHVVDPSVTLSYLFKFMTNMKTEFELEDYLIRDTSLEQIFLTFARAQRISVKI